MRDSHEHTEKNSWNDESERERRRVDTKGGMLWFDVTSDNFSLIFTERERERELLGVIHEEREWDQSYYELQGANDMKPTL